MTKIVLSNWPQATFENDPALQLKAGSKWCNICMKSLHYLRASKSFYKMKSAFLLIILSIILMASSCHKHGPEAEDNEVTITINKPASGENVNVSNIPIEIVYAATSLTHDIEIRIYPKNEPSGTLYSHTEHLHRKNATVTKTASITGYPAGTEFILETSACIDQDCELPKVSQSVNFFQL